MTSPQDIFVNRFFYPDHSATSQILSDLAFHLPSGGARVSMITSCGLGDAPKADLPPFKIKDDIATQRVYRPRFGRSSLASRAIDYLAMYQSFAAAAWRLSKPRDFVIAKTDLPLLSVALARVASAKKNSPHQLAQDLYPELVLGLGMRALAPVALLMMAPRSPSLKAAHCNFVLGERMRDRLEAKGAGAGRIQIIPGWCDDELITPQSTKDNPLRLGWGLDHKFVIGYSVNLGRAHESTTLLDVAELLRSERNIIFLLIGGGYLTQSLQKEVERRRLAEMFQFRPDKTASELGTSLAIPDVHWIALLPAMEVLIAPSKFYGVAAAGRPIIAVTDPAGDIAKLVRDNQCGAVVRRGDGRPLAQVILDFKTDRGRLEQMGHNARALLDRSLRKKIALGALGATLTSGRRLLKQAARRRQIRFNKCSHTGVLIHGRTHLGRRTPWDGRFGHYASTRSAGPQCLKG
jgi:colanic acid biosynthesis glycosyl transferase WcaI